MSYLQVVGGEYLTLTFQPTCTDYQKEKAASFIIYVTHSFNKD